MSAATAALGFWTSLRAADAPCLVCLCLSAESLDGATVFSFDTGDGKPPVAKAAGARPAKSSAPAYSAPASTGDHAADMKAAWAEAVAVAGKK